MAHSEEAAKTRTGSSSDTAHGSADVDRYDTQAGGNGRPGGRHGEYPDNKAAANIEMCEGESCGKGTLQSLRRHVADEHRVTEFGSIGCSLDRLDGMNSMAGASLKGSTSHRPDRDSSGLRCLSLMVCHPCQD